jgi:hypothetical protein
MLLGGIAHERSAAEFLLLLTAQVFFLHGLL